MRTLDARAIAAIVEGQRGGARPAHRRRAQAGVQRYFAGRWHGRAGDGCQPRRRTTSPATCSRRSPRRTAREHHAGRCRDDRRSRCARARCRRPSPSSTARAHRRHRPTVNASPRCWPSGRRRAPDRWTRAPRELAGRRALRGEEPSTSPGCRRWPARRSSAMPRPRRVTRCWCGAWKPPARSASARSTWTSTRTASPPRTRTTGRRAQPARLHAHQRRFVRRLGGGGGGRPGATHAGSDTNGSIRVPASLCGMSSA